MSSEASDTLGGFATVRITGDDLDPQEITSIVHVEPTTEHKKGVRIQSSRSERFRITKFGMWYLSTRKVLASQDLQDHLRYVQDMVLTDRPKMAIGHIAVLPTHPNQRLADLINERSLELSVSVFWVGRPNAKPPHLPSRFTDLVASFNGKIETDFSLQSGDEYRRVEPGRRRHSAEQG